MARQTFYVTRDMKHPLYKTRMLTAGQQLDLDASAARLYRQLGVDMSDEKPKRGSTSDGTNIRQDMAEAEKTLKAADERAKPKADLSHKTKAELIKMLPADERKAAEKLTKAKIIAKLEG
jgi:hypothetical protein